MWNICKSINVKPLIFDTESSKAYNYVHKDIVESTEIDEETGEKVTVYDYLEYKVSKDDWELFKEIFETEEKVEINTNDISDNREGIVETFESTMLNTDDISTLRDGLMEVYEMLVESEVGV